MADKIIELLENQKVRQEVMQTIKEVWSYAGTLYDNPDEEMEEYVEKNKGASLWEEAWWRAEFWGGIDKVKHAFNKYVIQEMARPYRLTLEELVEAFLDLSKPDEHHYIEFESLDFEGCNSLYTFFVYYVKNHILSYQYSGPFPICSVTDKEGGELLLQRVSPGLQLAKGEKLHPSDLDGISSGDGATVWNKNGVSVRLLRGADVIKERPGDKKLYRLLAIIEGEMSTSACSMLQNEMSRILPTAIRSADLLQAEEFGGEYKVIGYSGKIPLLYKREIGGLPWGEELIERARPLIRHYLDAYYSTSNTGKKDSIDRRIRNAVCLLVESDNQPNNAIGLALSITAIEALLGEGADQITKTLSERVGSLLEPDRNQRNNATKFVKDLYGDRSDALHGRYLEKESKARTHARQLAAGVLSGVISRRDFRRRSGYEPETPPELLQDLDSSFASGEATGVEEYNVRELWKNWDKRKGKRYSSS
jgi:hypothetical protein